MPSRGFCAIKEKVLTLFWTYASISVIMEVEPGDELGKRAKRRCARTAAGSYGPSF